MVDAIVVGLIIGGLVVSFYVAGWFDGRDSERAKIKDQLQALRAGLRLADAAWDARQELRQASIEAAERQAGEDPRRRNA